MNIADVIILALAVYAVYASAKSRRLEAGLRRLAGAERTQSALWETSSLIASSLNMASVLEVLVDSIRSLTGAQLSAVLLVRDGKLTGFRSSLGEKGDCVHTLSGVLEGPLNTKASFRAADLQQAPGFKWLPELHPEIGSIMVVPILLRGRLEGELVACNKKEGGGFTETDEAALTALAGLAALAVKKEELDEEVRDLSVRDSLTGLFNNKALKEKLEAEIERSVRFRHSLGIILIDIDDFRHFNERNGRPAGDEALRAVAGIIRNNTRAVDFAARCGGEEFLIVQPESQPEQAARTAERIRAAVESHSFQAAVPSTLTLSAGVASYPVDSEDIDDLLKEADSALFTAKKKGKNRVFQAGRYSEDISTLKIKSDA